MQLLNTQHMAVAEQFVLKDFLLLFQFWNMEVM